MNLLTRDWKCLSFPQSDRDDEEHTTNSETTTHDITTERVIGGRQRSVDDGEALVYKLNEPSSLLVQR
jgi:hypothetical protein